MEGINLTIEGPVGISEYFSQGLKKHIYLIADVHVREMKCPDPNARPVRLTDFLAMTFNDNPNKVIDFFLERPYLSQASTLGRQPESFKPSYLEDLALMFDSIKFDNLRLHNVDVRGATQFSRDLHDLELGLSRMFVTKVDQVNDKNLSRVRNLRDEIPNYIESHDLLMILTDHKIIKQFENISDPDLRRIVIEYWMNRGKLLYDRLILNLSRSQQPSYDEKDKVLVGKLAVSVFAFGLFLMDAYAIGRMFRSFRDTEDPKYIMVYAGAAHTKSYEKFFKYLGLRLVGKNVSDLEGEDFQCLRLGLRLPFFHHAPDVVGGDY